MEVRRGLKEAGAIPLLVGLLASKNGPGVQEWAAYALRKASSRATDPQLGKSMIKEAIEAGGDRLLVEMLSLRSRDAQEEAQQTLEYFEVDVEHVQSTVAFLSAALLPTTCTFPVQPLITKHNISPAVNKFA